MKSYFKNWFKHYSQKKELSETFAAKISGNKNKLEIQFQEPFGKKILFALNEQDSINFIRQFNEILN